MEFQNVIIDYRYIIYPDGVIYDTETDGDIPPHVFQIRDKICNSEV